MSGGSWEYVYRHFEETAGRLARERDPLRRAFGAKVRQVAKAMHAIEWVDSSDYADGEEVDAIREAIGDADAAVLEVLIADAKRAAAALHAAIDKAEAIP